MFCLIQVALQLNNFLIQKKTKSENVAIHLAMHILQHLYLIQKY